MIAFKTLIAAALIGGGAPVHSPPDIDSYARVLTAYVDSDGLVDYGGLKLNRAGLDAYTSSLARTDPAVYASWTRTDKLAFWINTYNALTLSLIIDNYPIQPSKPTTGFPRNSIRQIPGAWDQKRFQVMGVGRTLDEIEHKVIRAEFAEPRIHMALVCAALSCPKLRREPYRGANLDGQLDAQSRAFLSDLRRVHIDRESQEVWASPIFQWFADDFLPGATTSHEAHAGERKALAAFARRYLGSADRTYLETGAYKLQFFEYDWTLNDQAN